MGAPTTENKPLDLETEMALIASQRAREQSQDEMARLNFFKASANTTLASELAGTVLAAVHRLQKIAPTQARSTSIDNTTWRKSGYKAIADENEALGLKAR